jgi:hypothetical protein
MSEASFPVKRAIPRFSFIAEAEVTALPTGTRLLGRVSELSSRGCYVDTPEGYPAGTVVCLRIRYGGSTCELAGRVIYRHDGWGMGVLFEEITAAKRGQLDGWLAELARKTAKAPRRLVLQESRADTPFQ